MPLELLVVLVAVAVLLGLAVGVLVRDLIDQRRREQQLGVREDQRIGPQIDPTEAGDQEEQGEGGEDRGDPAPGAACSRDARRVPRFGRLLHGWRR
ncbi:MAG: hypothetical protein HC927_09250 [Deltaproteobacteria bacterium]|nr:hypothetical protein [Deltaproteobacteria bacterium]